METTQKDNLVSSFQAITNATTNDAKLFLGGNEWNLDTAINSFYTLSGDTSQLVLPKHIKQQLQMNVSLPANIDPNSDLLKWPCTACTFLNGFTNLKCSICNTQRSEDANKMIADVIKEQQHADLEKMLKEHPFPIHELLVFGYLHNEQETTLKNNKYINVIPKVILDLCLKFCYQTPQFERKEMSKLGDQNFMDNAQIGDYWFAVSTKWYKEWIKFTEYDKMDDLQIIGGVDNLHKKWVLRPNYVDNSMLCQDLMDNSNKLRNDIIDHSNNDMVIWLSPNEWDLLYKWYGCNYVFGRKVFVTHSLQKYIVTHPIQINVVFANKITGEIDLNTKTVRDVGPNQTIRSLALEIEQELYDITFSVRRHQDFVDTPYVHIWAKFGIANKIYPIDKKYKVTMDDLKTENDERWVEIPDDYQNFKIYNFFNRDLNENETNIKQQDIIFMMECKNVEKYKLPQNDVDFNLDDVADGDGDDDEKKEKEKEKDKILFSKPWPRSQAVLTWEALRVGDIVDAMDEQAKWYEAFIRYKGVETVQIDGDDGNIIEETSEFIIVHYIGWNIKWVDKLTQIDFETRVRPRHAITAGPHRPRRRY